MRVGSICYATSRGLGHLCRDFHRHGLVTDVMVVEHPGVPTNRDWYPGAPTTPLRQPDVGLMREFCKGKDAMLFFETPFHWPLLDYCRGVGVKTFLVTMYECTPTRRPHPYKYICPSLLDVEYFGRWDHAYLPLPVEYPWRLRTRAFHFVHNGGYLGVRARGGVQREGTTTLIEAMQHVKAQIKLTIRVQENVSQRHVAMCMADPRIRYLPLNVPYDRLYAEGDVAVGAQRWNGCSLPLQEAFAAGMLVINTNRFPMNTWLPRDPLVPARREIPGSKIGRPYLEFTEADVHPEDLAATIDKWFGRDITEYSLRGKHWAAENSWETLKPRWQEVLQS